MPSRAEILAQARGRQAVNDPAGAERLYRQALAIDADDAEALNALGGLLGPQGRLSEAVACIERALVIEPNLVEAHYNLASAALAQNNLTEAIARWQRVVQLQPGHVDAHHNLATAFLTTKDLDQAAACWRRVVELKPESAEAHHTLARVLAKQGQLDDAAACCRTAVALRPDFAVAWNDLGILLAQHDRYREAQGCFRKALELEPGRELWRLNSMALCPSEFDTNEELDAYRRRLLEELESFAQRKITFQPAELLTSNCRPSFNLQFHGRDERPLRQAYARVFEPSFPAGRAAAATGRPRIGMVVTDWHELGFLRSLGGVLDRIDTGRIDVVIFGSARGQETLRAGLRNPAVRVLGISTQFEQFVAAIRAAAVDVLYYWEVGTDNTNYFLPFLRLAPVQCTSWGIQVTSGIPTLDYYLSSTLAEPDDAQAHYSERLILADTLLTFQRRTTLPLLPKSREHFGLSADQHHYLCAQQLGKFQPDFDPILAGILRGDPRGVIVVTEDRRGPSQKQSQDLRRRLAARLGDVADRIVFVPYQAGDDYLSLVATADVLLDPLYFGGVNSTYDGFSLAKPIVTLPSSFQRGRYTLACYRKMGLLDCVARDADDYIEIAVRLGTDAEYREQMTAAIGRANAVLFEDLAAVREHERIFAELAGRARSAT